MLFNSYAFIFFYLPAVLLGFFWLARVNHSYAAGWLALASLFFYGYWNPAYVGLLLGSIVLRDVDRKSRNSECGFRTAECRRKKAGRPATANGKP
jgi:hypothetical protein